MVETETFEEAVDFEEEIEEDVIYDIVESIAEVIGPEPNPYVSKIDLKVMDELFSGWDNAPEIPENK